MSERPGIAEQLDHLGVAGLVEFGIVCAHRVKGLGLMQADKLVAFLREGGDRVGGGHGYGEHQPPRFGLVQRTQRRCDGAPVAMPSSTTMTHRPAIAGGGASLR